MLQQPLLLNPEYTLPDWTALVLNTHCSAASGLLSMLCSDWLSYY